jgi:hypothetical protein
MLRASLILSLGLAVLVPGLALAQTPAATATGATAPVATGTAAAPAGTATPGGNAADSGDQKPKGPVRAATGYGYGTPPSGGKSSPAAHRAAPRPGGPVATFPGFEVTGDGGSRVFVQLTQLVPVEERRAAGAITYVLRGARVNVWNNHNALVTVHFNTPVTRARLVSVGADTHLVVELRSAATPTYNVSAAPGGGAVLSVVFPKGDFITGNEETDEENAQKAQQSAQPAAPAKPAKKK